MHRCTETTLCHFLFFARLSWIYFLRCSLIICFLDVNWLCLRAMFLWPHQLIMLIKCSHYVTWVDGSDLSVNTYLFRITHSTLRQSFANKWRIMRMCVLCCTTPIKHQSIMINSFGLSRAERTRHFFYSIKKRYVTDRLMKHHFLFFHRSNFLLAGLHAYHFFLAPIIKWSIRIMTLYHIKKSCTISHTLFIGTNPLYRTNPLTLVTPNLVLDTNVYSCHRNIWSKETW